MKTSKAGFDLIKEFEGYHKALPNGDAEAYLDPVGIWTIGWGSIMLNGRPVRRGDVISRKLAEELLDAEVAGFEKDVERLVDVELNENEFSSLVSLCYNIGAGAFAKSTARRLLNAGDRKGCAEAILLFNKGTINGQLVELPGLTRRRKAEKALFLKPVAVPEPVVTQGRPYAPCPVPLPWTFTFSNGSQGAGVYHLQCALIGLGYLGWPKQGELVGEVFNEHVEYAVKKLQRDHGLKDDGIVGTQTRALIERLLTAARDTVSKPPQPEKPARCVFEMDLEPSQALRAGTLSFFDANGVLVRKVPCTSGLPGYQTDAYFWTRGAGPCPPVPGQTIRFSDGYHLNTRGIEGWFFPMTPDPIMRNGQVGRSEIGLHRDANVPGTAGCLGLLLSKKDYDAFVEWAKPLGELPLVIRYS